MNLELIKQLSDADLRSVGIISDKRMTVKSPMMAMDSDLLSTPNASVQAILTTEIIPEVIHYIMSKNKVEEIYGSVRRASDITKKVMFNTMEATGTVATYGDYSNAGTVGGNVNNPTRDTYHYQTNIMVGDEELRMAGAGYIDLVKERQIAAAGVLNKFQNETYLYGLEGLETYGLLNDPNLLPTVTLQKLDTLTYIQAYAEFEKLFLTLVEQSYQNVDMSTPMTLTVSTIQSTKLNKPNEFGMSAMKYIKEMFPNLRVETIPEFSATAGEYWQLVVEEYMGVKTLYPAYTEKYRAFALDINGSNTQQKIKQGTIGMIILRPIFVATGLSV